MTKCLDYEGYSLSFRVTADNVLYQCPECPRSFKTRPNLRKHREAMHGATEQHACQLCGLVFNTATDVAVHVKSEHEGRQRIWCPVGGCDFYTFMQKALNDHMRRGRHGK